MSSGYQDFKVLFLYPNIQMRTIAPMGVAVMSALLKEHGFTCDVFDCTRYKSIYIDPERDYDSSHEKFMRMDIHKDRVRHSNVLPFDWGSRNITLRETDMGEDFKRKVESFGPSLVAVSLVENTFELGMDLLKFIPADIPVVAGGVFCTYAPEVAILNPRVTYVCRGEGEYPLLDLAKALADGKATDGIPNVWAKRNGHVTRNALRPAININELPMPDYGIFEESLLYTPMQGRVWRAVGFETQRGCPYTCTYCNSPSNNQVYSAERAGNFYRKKGVPRLKAEMEHLIANYKPELIYFVADTFLAMSRKELDEFSEFYQSYRIPFWMNTRAETINEHSAEHLAKMNCLRFNIGIEHGNFEFRKNVLKRPVTNEETVRAFRVCARYSDRYTCVANNIIGMPTETPKLAFDTIEMNRQLPDEIVSAGAFIFTPYFGTALRDLAVRLGFMAPDLICTEASNTTARSLLHMPEFPTEAIQGLMRTFSFYVKFPKDRWAEVDQAAQMTEEGDRVFDRLREEYAAAYLNPTAVNRSPNLSDMPNFS
jgi:hypothetical protein